MKIKIPTPMVRTWDRLGDWGNVEVWRRVRRLDLLVVVFFFACISRYWHTGGWFGALQGGAYYIAITAMALFLF
jgi:hypothetical protein